MGFIMSIGDSGRIVLEIDPILKKQLYKTLKADGLSMKDWFLEQAIQQLNKEQLSFNLETSQQGSEK